MKSLFFPTKEDVRIRDAHLNILKKGISCWHAWRKENTEIVPQLFDCDLSFIDTRMELWGGMARYSLREVPLEDRPNFTECNMYGANFSGGTMMGANFSGSRAVGACFDGCNLVGAIFTNGSFVDASFRGANIAEANLGFWERNHTAALLFSGKSRAHNDDIFLYASNFTRAEFSNANLKHVIFEGVYFKGSSFRQSDLRYSVGFVSDSNLMKDAILDYGGINSGFATDPWLVLKRAYTGPRMILSLMFLAVFLIPYVAKTIFWLTYEQVYNTVLPKNLEFNSTIIEGKYQIWQLLIGLDENIFSWLPALLLLLYNVVRLMLTQLVSNLREEEHISGTTPQRSHPYDLTEPRDFIQQSLVSYGWMVPVHKVMSIALWVTLIMSSYKIALILTSEVTVFGTVS